MALNNSLITMIDFIREKTGEKNLSPSDILNTWLPVGIGYQQDRMIFGRPLTLKHPTKEIFIDASLSIVPKGHLPGEMVGLCIESDNTGEYYTATHRFPYETAGKIRRGLLKVDEMAEAK